MGGCDELNWTSLIWTPKLWDENLSLAIQTGKFGSFPERRLPRSLWPGQRNEVGVIESESLQSEESEAQIKDYGRCERSHYVSFYASLCIIVFINSTHLIETD